MGGQGAEAIKQRGKNSGGDGTGGAGCRRSLKNGSVSTSEGLKPREWRAIRPLLPLSEITHTPQTPPRGPIRSNGAATSRSRATQFPLSVKMTGASLIDKVELLLWQMWQIADE